MHSAINTKIKFPDSVFVVLKLANNRDPARLCLKKHRFFRSPLSVSPCLFIRKLSGCYQSVRNPSAIRPQAVRHHLPVRTDLSVAGPPPVAVRLPACPPSRTLLFATSVAGHLASAAGCLPPAARPYGRLLRLAFRWPCSCAVRRPYLPCVPASGAHSEKIQDKIVHNRQKS